LDLAGLLARPFFPLSNSDAKAIVAARQCHGLCTFAGLEARQPQTGCGPNPETSMRIAFAAALFTLAAAPVMAEDLVFTLVNDSTHTLTEMYVSPVGEDEWGENILLTTVEPGVSGDVTIADGLEVCDYDMRFVSVEGGEVEQTQNLCELGTFTVTD
jgi:hypothetical protein